MDRRYQVFVSSTFQDLVEERREIIQALLELECFPAGMEMFPAANDDQWTLIKSVIDQSDYYLVVVGGRYGSTTEDGISYTEMEYDYAVEKGIPVIGFVHADPLRIPAGKSEMEPAAAERLEAFRAKVKGKMIKEYSDPSGLGALVVLSLIKLFRSDPRPGWVRGDQAMTPEVRTEIAELRAQIAEKERDEAEASIGQGAEHLDHRLAQGPDEVTLGVWWSFFTYGDDKNLDHVTATWDDIVATVGPKLIDETSESSMKSAIEGLVRSKVQKQDHRVERAGLTEESWGTILIQLRALGVIEVSSRNRSVKDKQVYWKLTRAGDNYVTALRAIPREVR